MLRNERLAEGIPAGKRDLAALTKLLLGYKLEPTYSVATASTAWQDQSPQFKHLC